MPSRAFLFLILYNTYMWKFLISASEKSNWPNQHAKEVCFIGRSNVGKSSLINAITNNQYLARVSNTPGRTQLLNFFQDENKMLVDLPGYGYAKMPLKVQRQMITMIEEYFAERTQLVKVFVLIDAKVGPTEDDIMMLEYLQSLDMPVTVIITKADKANQSQTHASKKAVEQLCEDFVITSSHKGTNIANLRKIIDAHF